MKLNLRNAALAAVLSVSLVAPMAQSVNAKEVTNQPTEETKPVATVNKDALNAAVKDAVKVMNDSSKYSEESIGNFKKAYDAAVVMQAKKDATQKEVDKAVADLNAAKKALAPKEETQPNKPSTDKPSTDKPSTDKPAGEKVDYSVLEKVVSVVEQDGLKGYTDESAAPLKALIKDAKKVLANKTATQEEVNTLVNKIAQAIKNLEKFDREYFRKEANKYIDKYNEILKKTPNKYTKESMKKLADAIDQAKKSYNDKNETIEGARKALENLKAAYENLVEVKSPSKKPAVNPSKNNNKVNKQPVKVVKPVKNTQAKQAQSYNTANGSVATGDSTNGLGLLMLMLGSFGFMVVSKLKLSKNM